MSDNVKFGKGAFRHLRQEIKSDIINSSRTAPELRKEIARVFQVANRRIQNIEKKGEFSPAVVSLGKGDITEFSKFSMSGKDWVELKTEYMKAITFLRQPTSTATGVGQYTKHLRDSYNLTKEEYSLISDNLNNKLQSIQDSDYVERYLMRYKDFTGELKSEAKSVSDQIERESFEMLAELDSEIVLAAKDVLVDFANSLVIKRRR